MNKYQKAAALDLVKLALIGMAGGSVAYLLTQNFTATQIIFGLAVLLLGYTGVTLFKIQVAQHEYNDKLKDMIDSK